VFEASEVVAFVERVVAGEAGLGDGVWEVGFVFDAVAVAEGLL
jgi:hypothetical protein